MFGKFFTIYLIKERSEQYGILRIYDASELIGKICAHINEANILRERDMEKLLKNVRYLTRYFNRIVRIEADAVVDLDYYTAWLPKILKVRKANAEIFIRCLLLKENVVQKVFARHFKGYLY